MAKYTVSPALKKQWIKMEQKEQSFLEKQYEKGPSPVEDTVEKYVPEKLHDTLNTAFLKAFELVFTRGTVFIEKTCRPEKHRAMYRMSSEAAADSQTHRTEGAYARNSGSSRRKNLLLSGAEGLGMGILGIGIPDIPVFTAVILKSLYETAMSYGFSYDTEEEQIFLLKLIETSMCHGDALYENDRRINQYIYRKTPLAPDCAAQMQAASDSMAAELICMKFVQTIPVAGVVGGLYDVVFLNRILKYADCKYQRRHLYAKIAEKKGNTEPEQKQQYDF